VGDGTGAGTTAVDGAAPGVTVTVAPPARSAADGSTGTGDGDGPGTGRVVGVDEPEVSRLVALRTPFTALCPAWVA
jgi:hypothetical protein